jgi:hypothetical protein
MEYLLFTYPNCQKCEALRSSLQVAELTGAEYNLTQRESKFKIRDYLGVIRRDNKGGLILPTLILQDQDEVVAVMNTQQELDEWLRSKG